MPQSFFTPRQKTQKPGRIGIYTPAVKLRTDGFKALFDAAAEIVQDHRARADEKVANRVMPALDGELAELALQYDTDPAGFQAAAEEQASTFLANAGFNDEKRYRRLVDKDIAARSSKLFQADALRRDQEQSELNANRRGELLEKAVVAARAGDNEALAAYSEASDRLLGQAVAEGWLNEADAESEASKIEFTITSDRMAASVEQAWRGGGMAGARAAADAIRNDPGIDLPLEMRERAARVGLAEARALDSEARARRAEARSRSSFASQMAEVEMDGSFALAREFGDTKQAWDAFYSLRGSMSPKQARRHELALQLLEMRGEAEADAATAAMVDEHSAAAREVFLERQVERAAAGLLDAGEVGGMVARGTITAAEAEGLQEAVDGRNEEWLRTDEGKAYQGAMRAADWLGKGYDYAEAPGEKLRELDAIAEVNGLDAGAVDPAAVAGWGALPKRMIEQINGGLRDPQMATWAAQVLVEAERLSPRAHGQILDQLGAGTAKVLAEYQRTIGAVDPGSEDAQRTLEAATARVFDQQAVGRRELVEDERPFVRAKLQEALRREQNGPMGGFLRRHGLWSGADEIATPPEFEDAFDLALEQTLAEFGHPANQPIRQEHIDHALARTMQVWGPQPMEDGTVRVVQYPLHKVAGRTTPVQGLSDGWVSEMAFQTFKDELQNPDSEVYLDDDLTPQALRERVSDGEIIFKTRDGAGLTRGEVPETEMWVRTHDGRFVPVGGFGSARTFKPDWNDGNNLDAQMRLDAVRDWARWASGYVPGLDDKDVAFFYNLSGATVSDLERWTTRPAAEWFKKDVSVLRGLLGIVRGYENEAEQLRRIGEAE